MVRGSNLVKVRPNGRTYNRFFALDDDLSCIRWVPTSKKTSKAFGEWENTTHILKTVPKTIIFNTLWSIFLMKNIVFRACFNF